MSHDVLPPISPDASPHRRPRRSAWAFVAVLVAFAMLPIVAIVRDRLLPPPVDRIAWRTDLDAALREAAATGRPVLVDVTAAWCPPCQEMRRSTWPDARVGRAVADGFTPVLLDVDVPAGARVAAHYGVTTIPTILILDARGGVRDVGSFMTADELLAFLEKQSATVKTTTAPTSDR